MKKKLLVSMVVFTTLISTSMVFAFDFQSLDSKVMEGKISHEQAKKIIDKAIKKGEITEDQVREYMEQMRNNGSSENMKPGMFGPPSFGPGNQCRDEFVKKLQDAGITKDQLDAAHKKGPDAVKELFESHGIQPPPCPCKKQGFHGLGMQGRPDRNEFIKKLNEAGITKEQLDAAHEKGPDAVNELLKQHGIEPPQKM